MRGIKGVPADADRNNGFMAVIEEPGHQRQGNLHRVEVRPGGQLAKNPELATKVDGIWTSGIDYTVVNALKKSGKETSRSSAPTTTGSSSS